MTALSIPTPIYRRRDWVASGLTLLLALAAMLGPGFRGLTPPPGDKRAEVLTEIDLAPSPPVPKTQPKSEPLPQPKPEPKPQPRPEPKPQPKPEPKPQPQLQPRPQPAPQPTPAATPSPQPLADSAPATNAASAHNTATNAAPTTAAADSRPVQKAAASKGDPDRDYERSLRALVESRKKYPTSRQAMIEKPTGAVELCLMLDRGGKVKDVNVTTSSGSLLLDNTATRLVEGTTYPAFQDTHFAGQSQHRFCMKLDYQLPGNS